MSETLTAKMPRMTAPVNRLAASVIRSGIHYEEKFTPKSEVVSDAFLAVRPYPLTARPEDDLSGLKVGRFTVIGMAVNSPMWVVRCACGRYCYRKAKVLKTIELEGHMTVMCPRCAIIEKRSKTNGRFDSCKKSLHSAALPMYMTLQEILKRGLNATTRDAAVEALNLAEGKSKDGQEYIKEILKRIATEGQS